MIPPIELSTHGGVPIDTITGWPHIPRQGEYVWSSEGKHRVDEVIHSPQTNGITLKVTEVDPETHEPK